MPTTYSYLEAGTPIIWGPSGTGQDKLITLTSLGANAVREGEKSDSLIHATKGLPELLEILLQSAARAAPQSGSAINLFIGESDSATAGTDNPGGLTGTDALLAHADYVNQLYFAGSLVMVNHAGTGIQRQRFIYYPKHAFIIPVVQNAVVNTSGTAIALSGTAGDHRIKITPFYRVSQ
ncbi:MAG: hypothetical protein QXQ02_10485 [Halobacteria archaeon]